MLAALPADEVILRIYDEGAWDVEEKGDKSPLTRADREAHARISDTLRESTPDIPVLSEEGAHLPYETRRVWKRLWVVDPLDGTKEFLNRNGEFTVNIALIEDGVPVVGIVAVPVLDTYYLAARGHGAYRASRATLEPVLETARDANSPLDAAGERLQAALEQEAERLPIAEVGRGAARVVASRSHLNEETSRFIEALEKRYGSVELVQAGSAVKLCRVAEGAADYYPRLAPTMEWDTAAGDAVVRETDGRVYAANADGSIDGTHLAYNKKDLHNPYFVAVRRGIEL